MLSLSAHIVEMDCVCWGPGVIPADSISFHLFSRRVTTTLGERPLVHADCFVLTGMRMDWQVPLGPKNNPKLIVHATLLLLCAVICLSVSMFSVSSREITASSWRPGRLAMRII